MSRQGLRVTIWNEHVHEREDARVAAIYPDGIHGALGAAVQAHRPGDAVIFATLADPEQGLGDDRLAGTDVLVWWGHTAQEEVADERAGGDRGDDDHREGRDLEQPQRRAVQVLDVDAAQRHGEDRAGQGEARGQDQGAVESEHSQIVGIRAVLPEMSFGRQPCASAQNQR